MPKNNEVTEDEIEKEKRRVKKIMPSEKRIEEEKALQKAKELEKDMVPTGEEELKEVEEFMDEAESARKLLSSLDSKSKKKIKK